MAYYEKKKSFLSTFSLLFAAVLANLPKNPVVQEQTEKLVDGVSKSQKRQERRERKSERLTKKENESKDTSVIESVKESGSSRQRSRGFIEDPYTPCPQPLWEELCEYYGIDPGISLEDNQTDQTRFSVKQLYVRSSVAKKISFVSSAVQQTLEKETSMALKIVHTGIRMFERNENSEGCPMRICQVRILLILWPL